MSILPEISADQIKTYQDEISRSSSPSTTRRKSTSLNRFLSWAQGSGKISQNPIQEGISTVVTSLKGRQHKIGLRIWLVIGLTAALIVLTFFLVSRTLFPTPPKVNLAQETSVQTKNNNQNTTQTKPGSSPLPANNAVIAAWNLYTKLKLTDQNGEPQVATQSMTFKIYNSLDSTNSLYTSDQQTITPDANGYALISLHNVPTDLFFQNNQLYIEPQIGTQSASLRVPVQTANTASNLNGYTAANPETGADSGTIPVISADGSLILASQSAGVKANEGSLLLSGQAVTMKAADGSNGNLVFNPDGTGVANFLFEGSTGNLLNAQGPNLASGSLYYGSVPNNATGYNLLKLESGSPGLTTRFSVDSIGNTYTSGNLTTGGSVTTNNATVNGQLQLGRFTTNPTGLGAGSLIYNTTDGQIYLHNGTVWTSLGNLITPTFGNLSSGTNTSAAMVVGDGASLGASGTGTITATGLDCAGCVANATLANPSVTIDSSGILSGGGSVALGDTLTLTATEADTLASVSGRGADTSTQLSLNGGITSTGDLTLTPVGNVGIGTLTPHNKLDVSDSSTSTASAMIRNTSTDAATAGLAIQMDAATIGGTTRFINFLDANGNIVGKIQGGSATTVAYTGNGTDMAEYFTKDDPSANFEAGTVVCQGPNGVLACSSGNSDKIVGIVSDSPVFLGGVGGPNKVIVALTGQVPALISPNSPDIKPGDLLTVTDDGQTIKATGPGFVIGKAQNTWSSETGAKTIQIAIANIWADPSLALNTSGDLNIEAIPGNTNTDTKYQLTSGETLIDRIGAFAKVVTANIKAGTIETAGSFSAFQATVDNMLIKSGLVAANIQTRLISPLPDSTDITVQIGSDATPSGKFAIQNSTGDEVASIDNQGNASFSGVVHSQNIDEIQKLLTQVQTDQSTLLAATSSANLVATGSAQLDQLITSDLYVINQAAVNSLSVTNNLAVGNDFVISQSLGSGISGTSLNTLSGPLRLQSLSLAPVEIMNGLVSIDTHGNVNIAGDLNVAGKIHSSGLTLQSGQPENSTSSQLLSLQDQNGAQVAGVDASGSANFNSIAASQLVVAAPDATSIGNNVNGVITTNSTVGQAVVPANVGEITIKNPKVTDYSLVYVTPTSITNNYVLYIKSKQNGQFVVGFDQPLPIDVAFNWWIVQTLQ